MLFLAGAFNVIFGLTAVYRNNLVVPHANGYVTVWDIETWGWVHFVAGCLLILAAAGLWTISGWGTLARHRPRRPGRHRSSRTDHLCACLVHLGDRDGDCLIIYGPCREVGSTPNSRRLTGGPA